MIAAATVANEVSNAREVDPIAQEANTFEWPELGNPIQVQAPGPASLGGFTFNFTLHYDKAKHVALVDAKVGDVAALILTTTRGDGQVAWYMRGAIASRSVLSPPGGPKQCTIGIAFDETPTRYTKAVSYTHLTLPTKRIV